MHAQITPRSLTDQDHAESAAIETLRAAGYPVEYVTDAADDSGTISHYAHYRHAAPQPGARAYVDLGYVATGEDAAGQVDTVSRSNYRSLIRDYPESFTPTSYVNADALGAWVSDLPADLVTVLVNLRDQYPVYDEEDMSALESDEISESWDQYVRYDFGQEMRESCADEGDAWDALESAEQRELFWSVVSDLDICPEHDGHDVRWSGHYPAIAAEIAARLA